MGDTYRELANMHWHQTNAPGGVYPGDTKIVIGCLQRIADALTATNTQLEELLDHLKKSPEELQRERDQAAAKRAKEAEWQRDFDRRVAARDTILSVLPKNLKSLVSWKVWSWVDNHPGETLDLATPNAADAINLKPGTKMREKFLAWQAAQVQREANG